MNILLATYSYYPYNWGGTEVYIKGLVDYLKQQGHSVLIIAGMPPQAFDEHEMYYEDELLKTVLYSYDETNVLGIVLTNENTDEIYSKQRPQWVNSWENILKKIGTDWDILHMHAFTSATGLALMTAGKNLYSKVKVISSYHLPISCAKGTLMYGNKLQNCNIEPTVSACTSCIVSTKTGLPLYFTGPISFALQNNPGKNAGTALRIKYLVNLFFQSFNSFNALTDEWQVFSNQVKTVLTKMNVAAQKIKLIRHGVDPVFYANAAKQNNKQIFLYASRFEKVKGFETLLKAWNRLSETEGRELWMIGEKQTGSGEEFAELKKLKQRQDVIWYGSQSQSKLAELMKQAHCVIIPSECMEIGPLVFHEALAAGANVIASDIGGCKELAELYKTDAVQLYAAGKINALLHCIQNFKYSLPATEVLPQIENYKKVLDSYSGVIAG